MSQAVLEAKGITKRYGGVTALDDVSIAIRRGEVLCLAGAKGAFSWTERMSPAFARSTRYASESK